MLREQKPQDALTTIDAAMPGSSGIASVRLLYGRGRTLRSLRRAEESAKAFRAAGNAPSDSSVSSCRFTRTTAPSPQRVCGSLTLGSVGKPTF
jgi:hypothetical protein